MKSIPVKKGPLTVDVEMHHQPSHPEYLSRNNHESHQQDHTTPSSSHASRKTPRSSFRDNASRPNASGVSLVNSYTALGGGSDNTKKSTPRRMTQREQEDLNHLLKDMMEELQTFPGSSRPHAFNANNNNIYSDSPFVRGSYKNPSFSHSPAAAKTKPLILQHVSRGLNTTTGSHDHPDFSPSINHVDSAFKTTAGPSHSSPGTPLPEVPLTSGMTRVMQLQPTDLSSPSSPVDRASRGVSRSVTLTPTTMITQTKPLSAQVATLRRLKDHSPSSQPKPLVVSSVSPSRVTPFSSGPPAFKGTNVVPGARIGDQEEAKRVGIYASTVGKKSVARNEREELDDMINMLLDETRRFPDTSTVRRANSHGRTGTTPVPHSVQRSQSQSSCVSGPTIMGSQSGVAQTISVFESLNQQSQEQPPPRPKSPVFSAGRPRSPFYRQQVNNQLVKPRTGSPPRRGVPGQCSFRDRPTHVSRGPSTVNHHLQRSNSFVGGNTMRRGWSSSGQSAGERDATGVLAQNVEDPLPPHLLTRPTQWCSNERSRPYHARADSRPFTYGVTSASPLIQRRRVHSESTAYVSENRPIPPPRQDVEEGYVLVPRQQFYPPVNGNLYDVPSDLCPSNRDFDAISEISFSSSIYDDPSLSWLERQQLKLRVKKDATDKTLQDQKKHSKIMLSELDESISGRKVPAVNESESREASPEMNQNILNRMTLRDDKIGKEFLPSSSLRSLTRHPTREVVLKPSNQEEVLDESSHDGGTHTRRGKSPSYASGPTISSKGFQRQKSDLSFDRNSRRRQDPPNGTSHRPLTPPGIVNHRTHTGVQSPLYASVNLIDKHRRLNEEGRSCPA